MIENVKIEGEFKFKNQDIYDEKIDLVELRKKIGMVFQQPNPFPFSIYDNVTYGLRLRLARVLWITWMIEECKKRVLTSYHTSHFLH